MTHSSGGAGPRPATAALFCSALVRTVLLVLLLVSAGMPLPAQTGTPGLAFAGYPAGATLADVRSRLAELQGQPLRCTVAQADRTVQECRAGFPGEREGQQVEIWLSAIRDSAAILTLRTDVTMGQLQEWRTMLARQYGMAEVRVQGAQRMQQWVRSGRMLRLTWRVDQRPPVVSVSLVDGTILDAWGRRRAARADTAGGAR